MVKLVTLQHRKEWVGYVQHSANYDFYHTWHYHSLDKTGAPFLFVYHENDDFIALPFIRRDILGSNYHDLSCVYGYVGPISNKKLELIEDSVIDHFKQAFFNYVTNEKYVSIFLRLHPFFNQYPLMEKLGALHDNGQTVALDLTLSIEEQRKGYRQSAFDSIKHAWKKGYRTVEEKSESALEIFIDIYTETMHRVDASEAYFFSRHHYIEMLNTDEYDARLVTVYDGSKPICSSLVTFTNQIIQAYLIGTRTDYIHKSPAKFMVDEISLIGRRNGMRYFNLGGGVGFKTDSLFHWKTAFSHLCLDYKSWRYVADRQVYDQLLNENGIDKSLNPDFFPLYRYKLNQPA
jgi:hypothetical protein